MPKHKTGKLLAVLCVLGQPSWLASCRNHKEAGRAARVEVACESACQLSSPSATQDRWEQCQRACVAWVSRAEGCRPVALDYVECLRKQPSTAGMAPAWAEDGTVASGPCELERQLQSQCVATCAAEGHRRSGELSLLVAGRPVKIQYEVTDCGCGDCAKSAGVAMGGRCEAPRICAEEVLVCDGGASRKRLRACVGGRCESRGQTNGWLSQLLPGQACVVARN